MLVFGASGLRAPSQGVQFAGHSLYLRVPAHGSHLQFKPTFPAMTGNIGVLIIRIGFWGILYYSYNKEPPKYTRSVISTKEYFL